MRDVSLAASVSPRSRFVGAAALALKPVRGYRPSALRRISPLQKLGNAEVSATSAMVVEPDASARSLLVAALRRSGFEVVAAASAEEALRKLGQLVLAPELVLSEVALPGLDGLSFCELLQDRPEGAPRCVILLGREVDPALRANARAAGADELLPKPAYVGDIVALARLKLSAEFDGAAYVIDAAELPIPQLVRALLTSGRSGRVRLRSASAYVAFRDGLVVGCGFEGTSGRRALERVLSLGDGLMEVTFGPTTTGGEPVSLEELCTELLPKLRRFTRVLATSVPLDSVLAVDLASFSRALPSLPHDIDRLARLCDGKRTVRQVLAESPFTELVGLEALTRLYALGAVVPLGEDPAAADSGLLRVLERFAPPAVARWAASNDERVLPSKAASAAEVREGLAPELLRQLEAFQIRVVPDEAPEPFAFTSDDVQISEVSSPSAAPYELPEEPTEGTRALAAVAPPEVSASREETPSIAPSIEAHASLAAAAEELAPAIPPQADRPRGSKLRMPLLTGGAVLCLGAALLARPSAAPVPAPALRTDLTAVPSAWFQDAARLSEAGDPGSARELLEKVVAEDPAAADAWAELAVARFESGEASAAESAALRALALDPAQTRAERLLGEIALARAER